MVSMMAYNSTPGDPERLLAYIGDACIFIYRENAQTYIVHPSAVFVADANHPALAHLHPPEEKQGYARLNAEMVLPARVDVLQSWRQGIAVPGLAELKPTSLLVYEKEGQRLMRKLSDGQKHTVWVEKPLIDVLHPFADVLLEMFRFELLKNGWIRVRFKEQDWQVGAIFMIERG